MKKGLQKGIDRLSTRKDIANSQPDKRLKNYLVDSESKMQDTMSSFVSNHPIKPTPTLSIKNKRSISTNAAKVESMLQSSIEENTWVKSQQSFGQNTSSVEKPSKPQYSSVTISRKTRSLSTSETSKDNDLNKSATLHHDKNSFSSASTSKIHMAKIPKNKVSALPETHTNISLKPADIRTNQSGIDNINSDAKPDNHPSSPKTKDILSPGQQRAKIFSHVTVSKVKPIND